MTTRSGKVIKAPERLIAKDEPMQLWRSLDLSGNPNIPPQPQPQPQPKPKALRAPRAPRPNHPQTLKCGH